MVERGNRTIPPWLFEDGSATLAQLKGSAGMAPIRPRFCFCFDFFIQFFEFIEYFCFILKFVR